MTGDERDPGDEQAEPHADLLAALRHRDMVLRVLPVDEEAERLADQAMARRPRGHGRRLYAREVTEDPNGRDPDLPL